VQRPAAAAVVLFGIVGTTTVLLASAGCEQEDDVLVVDHRTTSFQRNVIVAVRQLEYGETASYGDLAMRAGSPRAARAVGQVMATNRVPIIIPCHRVIASGGQLGGYSAPSGLEMKRQLLALEGVYSLHSVSEERASRPDLVSIPKD